MRGAQQGTMLWFNETNDVGAIRSDDGERLTVSGSAFAEGKRPVGRCAGSRVDFELGGTPDEPSAHEVRFVTDVAPRRARTRQSTYRVRS